MPRADLPIQEGSSVNSSSVDVGLDHSFILVILRKPLQI